MSLPQPILEIEDLTVVRGKPLLDRVFWTVHAGEHWAVLGANGSGKSTLLNVINAFMGPASGSMRILGKQYGRDSWDSVKLSIGFVSGTIHNLIDDGEPVVWALVGGKRAMINFWGEAAEEELEEARQILRQVECGHLLEARWCQLSQGEKQKVLIGRALMARIRLLILDEPCAGLDPVARENFLGFLERSAAREKAPTHILVTHHVEEVTPSFTHVLILRQGRILAAGPKAEVLTSEILGQAFNASLELRQTDRGYRLDIKGSPRDFGI
jgi:iron complex transport system ATP-binding protein